MGRTFGRIANNWPTILIPVLLMAWARFGATGLALASFESATLYQGPYRTQLPAGPPSDPIAERVVLVVVDGLRRDTSETLDFLNLMRAEGSDRTLVAGQPSLSYPGWTVIGTGAWQEASGFASNYVERAVEIDSLFQAVGRAGGSTAIVGSPGWEQLYGAHADDVRIVRGPDSYSDLEPALEQDRQILAQALEVLDDPPELLLVHLPAVDIAGHGWGGASPEYRRAAAEVDGLIRNLADSLDLTATALFVTADHGHTDPGGHAGPEPEVLRVPFVGLGIGVRPGAYPTATQADIAPTVATLLGSSMPAHNQGRVLVDQIDAPPALLAARAVDVAGQVTLRAEDMMRTAVGEVTPDGEALERAHQALADGDYIGAMSAASEAIDEAEARWQDARASRLGRERLARLGIAAALLVPPALYLVWWRRRGWNGRAPALGAAFYLIVWNLNYHLIQRLTYSASWFNTDADIELFLTARVIEALISSALAVLLVAVLRRTAGAGAVAREAAHTLLLIGLAQMVQILAFYVVWGVRFEWHLPDFTQGFKYYLDVFQTTAAWPMTPLPAAAMLVALAPVVAWLTRTIEGSFRKTAPRSAG